LLLVLVSYYFFLSSLITLIADADIYRKVARPTQKPSTSLTGESSMVAIKPPVPIVDL